MRSLDRIFLALFCGIVFAAGLPAQSTPPSHPLDALKTQEYWTVYYVLRDSGKVPPATVTHSVLLHEPPKDTVLAWKPGAPIFREAEVILLHQGVTIEALVDISGRRLESWRERRDVQAPVVMAEFHEVG